MTTIRERARELRRQGLTFGEIQASIGEVLPKSTLSYWCKDIELSADQRARISRLAQNNLVAARKAAAESKAEQLVRRTETGYNNARKLVGKIDLREAKIALAMLYLGEGYKYPSYRGLRLGSSDPGIVSLYVRLLRLCYGITPERLKCLIGRRADQRLDELVAYWADITGIPEKNFYRTQADPRTINKPTKNREYMGVAAITCPGVDKQLELARIAEVLLSADSD